MVGGRGKVPNIKGEPRIHTLVQSLRETDVELFSAFLAVKELSRSLGPENNFKTW